MKLFGQHIFVPSFGAAGLMEKLCDRRRKRIELRPQESLALQRVPALQVSGSRLLEAMKKLGESENEARARTLFERRISEHLDPSTRLAFRLTGNWHAAEEIVQETMLRAIRHRDSFRQDARFKTWLYRILINVFRDYIRNKSRQMPTTDETDHQPSRDQSAAVIAQANELGDLVGVLVAALPQRQKEVLVLSSYEALSNQEIASTLGISVANVHSNLSTARKRLKQQLATYIDT